MKTTFTTFIFMISTLFGFQTTFTQQAKNQIVKYNFNPLVLNSEPASDTFDLSIKNNVVITPNYKTPYSQLECYNFGSFVECNTDSVVEMTLNFEIIRNNNQELVFEDSILYSGNCNTELILPECFTPSWNVSSYSGYYSLVTDTNDSIQDNNFDTIVFEVSDYIFAKENGGTQTIVPDTSSWDAEEAHSWTFGNYFYIVNPFLYQFNSATFAIGNADADGLAGKLMSIYLYKWDDLNEDSNVDSEEREKVAFAIYEIQGTESASDLITIPLLGFPNGDYCPPVPEGDQAYVLMIEYWTLDQIDLELVASTEFNYGPMIFQSEQSGNPRYAGFLGVGENLQKVSFSSLGFGYDVVPVLRLNLDMTDNVKNSLPPGFNLKLSPNPAHDFLNIELDMKETQKETTIKIFDINGKLLKQENYKNIKYEKINFDLSKFAAGAYFLQLVTDAGVSTERFVVHHF